MSNAALTPKGVTRGLSRAAFLGVLPQLAPYLGLAILLVLWNSRQYGVLTVDNLNLQTAAALTLALAATGQTIVVLLGGIDLSIAGVISITTCVLATRTPDTTSGLLILIAVLLALGAGFGAVNGILVGHFGLQPLVATLATWSVASGTALLILNSDGGTVPTQLYDWLSVERLGLAPATWGFLALAAFAIWFRRTRLGVSIRAIGSDSTAAYLSGVDVLRTTIAAYALSSVFAVLAGLFLASQTFTGSPIAGEPYILTSLAAVVVGGTVLSGGRGGSGGSLVGAALLITIASVVFAFEISSYWTPLLVGVLLILSVLGNSVAEVYAERKNR